uniref:Uncharacterized protein n=1 Tax=Anguilla anguilla TaxID=7936 RepID=A0A0E9QMX4_ANGAN
MEIMRPYSMTIRLRNPIECMSNRITHHFSSFSTTYCVMAPHKARPLNLMI